MELLPRLWGPEVRGKGLLVGNVYRDYCAYDVSAISPSGTAGEITHSWVTELITCVCCC